MQCEAIIPATDEAEAHRCEAPATMLARSMKEVVTAETERGDGSTVKLLDWEPTTDHVYCDRHFIPAWMRHIDGSISWHAAMAVSDA